MLLQQIFLPERISLRPRYGHKDELFKELVLMLSCHAGPGFPAKEALGAIHARESLLQTGIGGGIALPHGKVPGLRGIMGALAFISEGLDYGAQDGVPVRLAFLLLSDAGDAESHLSCLKRIARFLDAEHPGPSFLEACASAATPQDLFILVKTREDFLDLQE